MIRVLIAADFCPTARVANLIETSNFDEVFGQVRHLTGQMDYSVVNFECPVVNGDATPIVKQGPVLRCSMKAVEAIKWAGFDMTTLANNHFYDYADKGVCDTITALQSAGIAYVGGGANLEEASRIVFKEIGRKQVAFVNFCENEFSIATEVSGGSAPLNPVANYYQIREAHEKAAYVVVIVHGGHEYYQMPSPRMKQIYRFFIDAGADVVVNHHQHCFSGYEHYKCKPIFYGLGNFCFDRNGFRGGIWNEGFALELRFEGNVVESKLHPYIQGDERVGVELMNEEQQSQFDKRIREINSLITDDKAVNKSLIHWQKSDRVGYLASSKPYSNRYVRALRRRRLIPSFRNRMDILSIYNCVNCEAHRDVFLRIVKKFR